MYYGLKAHGLRLMGLITLNGFNRFKWIPALQQG